MDIESRIGLAERITNTLPFVMNTEKMVRLLLNFEAFTIKRRRFENTAFLRNRAFPAGGFAISTECSDGRVWYLFRFRFEGSRVEVLPSKIKHFRCGPLSKEIPEGFDNVPVVWSDTQPNKFYD